MKCCQMFRLGMNQQYYKICPSCQRNAVVSARYCDNCGHQFRTQFQPPPNQTQFMYGSPTAPVNDNSWLVVAILLGVFLGVFGAHRFYLGHTSSAIAMLVLTIFGIVTACFIVGYLIVLAVATWALVDVILIATGSLRPMRPMH